MTIKPDRMAAALDDGMLATDLADHLVRQGLPFRQAHRVVGQLVRLALERGVGLAQLDLATLQACSPRFAPEVLSELTHRGSLQRRNLPGGTGPAAVAAQLEAARAALET
jgi:argininosuccinate lyase